MLSQLQLFSIIYYSLSVFIAVCESNEYQVAELNETFAQQLIKSQLIDLRSEQAQLRLQLEEQQRKLAGIIAQIDRHQIITHAVPAYGRNCAEVTARFRHSGIYDILLPSLSNQPFQVSCDTVTRGGGWTIIMRRMDGSVDFYRNWTDYKRGFGEITGEFFLGLDRIHALTAESPHELIVILEDGSGEIRYESYDEFAIGDELDAYVLHTLGKANGTAGDSLSQHLGQKFTTFDRDNDKDASNCAKTYTGAWWYKACHRSNLAGKYNDNTYGKGITWYTFRGDSYSLKRAVMMIRPK